MTLYKFMINVMQMMIFATGMVCASRDNILIMLERVATFGNMNQNYVRLLEPLFEHFTCPSGTTVIEQGQPADYLYLILDGKVQVTYKPYDGTSTITVAHVEKDGVFGWSAVVGSHLYTSSVTAIEDLDTYRIHGDELRRLCVEHPEAGKEILERMASVVSTRWTNSHEQVKSILVKGMKC
jgi:CRP/FNR family transcriptional regulator, cyclic AMP receptor protein